MKYLAATAVALLSFVGAAHGSSCTNKKYDKCGGQDHAGKTCCPTGYICTFVNQWYSQCRPGTSPTPTPPVTCAAYGQQCGGSGWTGPTCCEPGDSCIKVNSGYSECQHNSCYNKPNKKPHIVVVVADDLGMGDTGYTGRWTGPDGKDAKDRTGDYLVTPNLDALASTSLTFKNFYAASTCSPSRSALLTGRYPWRNGYDGIPILSEFAGGYPTSQKLLPEYLDELGYKTHGFGKWHMGHYKMEFTPIERGFSTWKGNMEGGIEYYSHVSSCQVLGPSNQNTCSTDPVNEPFDFLSFDRASDEVELMTDYTHQYSTSVIRDWAVDAIDDHNSGDGPLFMYVAFNAPHSPLQPPPGDNALCRGKGYSDSARNVLCSMTYALDSAIGSIVDKLKAKNYWKDTYFVFVSDNGGDDKDSAADNGGFRGEKGQVWDGGMRTPAIIHIGDHLVKSKWWPNIRGVTRTDLVHVSDLLITGVKATKANVASNLDGVDLWSSLVCNLPGPRTDIQVSAVGNVAKPDFLSFAVYTVMRRTALIKIIGDVMYKLVFQFAGTGFVYQLYDLTNDPTETTSVYDNPDHMTAQSAMLAQQNAANAIGVPNLLLSGLPTTVEEIAKILEAQGATPQDAADQAFDQFYVKQCLYPIDRPEYFDLDCSSYPDAGAPNEYTPLPITLDNVNA